MEFVYSQDKIYLCAYVNKNYALNMQDIQADIPF